MAWYKWKYDSMELMNISKKEGFEPMNYNPPGIYKFYSTIINARFDAFRERVTIKIKKKDNSCIVVSTDGSTIKSNDMFNATVDYFHRHI